MELSTVTQFDEFYSMQRGKISFPSLCIEKPGDELVVILDGLPEGDLPVIIPFNGRLVRVKSIARTPLIVRRILALYEVTMLVDADNRYRVTTIEQLLDGDFNWMA
jgi:hypothetical protein